eukprot:sb/3474412/
MQEFMILPTGASSFTEAMKIGSEVYHNLKAVIKSKYGWMRQMWVMREVSRPTSRIIERGWSWLWRRLDEQDTRDLKYDLDFKNKDSKEEDYLSSDALGDVYLDFIKSYPVLSIEDPFDQDHWDAWSKLTSQTPHPNRG